jgi:hypothetical protein
MEPKYPNKKHEDILKNINFSFSVPFNVHRFNHPVHKKETVEEALARLDEVDETIDVMTSYPQAKKMLDKVYGKL